MASIGDASVPDEPANVAAVPPRMSGSKFDSLAKRSLHVVARTFGGSIEIEREVVPSVVVIGELFQAGTVHCGRLRVVLRQAQSARASPPEPRIDVLLPLPVCSGRRASVREVMLFLDPREHPR